MATLEAVNAFNVAAAALAAYGMPAGSRIWRCPAVLVMIGSSLTVWGL